MCQQPIQTAIQIVLGRQREIRRQQIGQGAVPVPFPMQAPFAARIDQPIGAEHHQNLRPRSALATLGQTLAPELVQLQFMPEAQKHPAPAPLARPLQAELREADLDRAIHGVRWNVLIAGKKRQLVLLLRLNIEHFDALKPGLLLRIVDLAQIKHLPLDPPPARTGNLFGDAVIVMLLAVLATRMTFEIHAVWTELYPPHGGRKEARSVAGGLGEIVAFRFKQLRRKSERKSLVFPSSCESRGNSCAYVF